MIDKELELPKGWTWKTIKEISTVLGDGLHGTPSYSEDGEFYFINGNNLSDGRIEIKENTKRVSEEEANKYRKPLNNKTILVSINGTLGNTSFYNGEKVMLGKSACYFNVKNDIDKFFIRYCLKSQRFLNYAFNNATGSTIKNVGLKTMREFLLPIPPLSEQQEIVAKIEELLSELDQGKQQLETARKQLKVYRQAVLKWAFEGKLTSPEVKEGELPESWKWKTIKEISSVLGDGLHGTPSYTEEGDYYFINGNNLSNGKIEIKGSTKRVSFEEFNKYKKPLNEKTIFVSINGTLGNTAFYNGEKVMLGKSACYFNVIDSISKFYIRYCLTSQRFLNYASTNATGSTIKNVGLKTMREFNIPVPPTLGEQNQVVQEIESRLSVCDKVEETIDQSLQQAETLRQSILKRAFEGKLIFFNKPVEHKLNV